MAKYSEERPWGRFEQFVKNESCTVKIHYLKAKGETSLQYHKNRDEFIKIIKGEAKITVGNDVHNAKVGDEIFIPREARHRFGAPKGPAKILEISFGDFDEEDIVGLEDKYNRT